MSLIIIDDDDDDFTASSAAVNSICNTKDTVLVKEYDYKDAAILKLFFDKELIEIASVGIVTPEPPKGPGLKLLIKCKQSRKERIDPLIKDLDAKLGTIEGREVTVPADAFAKLVEHMHSEEKRLIGAQQRERVLYLPDIVSVFFWPGNEMAVLKLKRELGTIDTGSTRQRSAPNDQAVASIQEGFDKVKTTFSVCDSSSFEGSIRRELPNQDKQDDDYDERMDWKSLYRNQVKELKDEIEEKRRGIQDLQADVKRLAQEKESLGGQLQLTLAKADSEHLARTMAEEQLSDVEKEKTMLELEVKELITRHKSEIKKKDTLIASLELGVIGTGGTRNRSAPSDQTEGENPSGAGSLLYPDLKITVPNDKDPARSLGRSDSLDQPRGLISSAMRWGTSPKPAAKPQSHAFVKRFSGEKLSLLVYNDSILHLPVEVIVSAANDNMDHGGGVAKVISDAAGWHLDKESKDKIYSFPKGLLPVSKNIVTTAGKLRHYGGVIHAVGPQWYDSKYRDDKVLCLDHLEDTIKNILDTCDREGYQTVAMPAISAGIYGVPKELCADMYVKAAAKYSQIPGRRLPKELHIVDIDQEILDLVKKSVENYDKNPESIDQRKTVPKYLASRPQFSTRGRKK